MKSYSTLFFLFILLPLFSNTPNQYQGEISLLINELTEAGVPAKWCEDNVEDERFEIYEKMPQYFDNMAEHKVKRNEKDEEWYMSHFAVQQKVSAGKDFIIQYQAIFTKTETRQRIPRELITAILGIESNFGDAYFKGKFYTFPALVSQFVLLENRRNYALCQLVALYRFEQICKKGTYYFIGSFAGACGWGQFIPESLLNYFVDENENPADIDLYSIEDNIASVSNYFYKNGLANFDENDKNSVYDAIFRYNRSTVYVKAVYYIYNELMQLRNY